MKIPSEKDQADYQKASKKMILVFAALVACYIIINVINSFFGLQDDNPAEEAIEAGIQTTTGICVDFTPGSQE